MATYFHGNPEIPVGQDGGLQTMVLMNPSTYVHYNSDQDPPPSQPNNTGNLLLFNASVAGNILQSPHHPPQPSPHHPGQQFDNSVSVLHGFIPRVHYNLYGSAPADSPHSARETPLPQQGLSLSLSSDERRRRSNPGFGSGGSVSPGSGHVPNVVVSGMQGLVLSSKYLKAAQELLDEVVSVNNTAINHASKSELSKKSVDNNKATAESAGGDEAGGGEAGDGGGGKAAAELTAPERQEIQMKKAKLVTMLDEVDQRYKQYHHQMHTIISSFEQAAGIGSAKTYTSLALKTISKQFRSLKDAIVSQIKAVNKSLGEEDGKIEGGSSRLRFVDHHLRQQRALQQLGMIHHNNNAWRPQRGLPERAVSVLRAWLFEHFLHPYPKDSDKLMLAKQTGLTRSQVSNWFINARVRLWKPMVEEMYLEEMKEQEKNNGSSEDQKTSKNDRQNENSASKSIGYSNNQEKSPVSETPQNNFMLKQDSFMNNNNHNVTMSIPVATSASTSPTGGSFRNPSGFSIGGTPELEGITQGSPKKPRTSDLLQSPISVPSVNMDVNKVGEASHDNISPKFRDEKQFSFIGSNTNFIGGFGQYPIAETGRFEAEPFTPRYSGNNGVSLTLGLPHCENFSVSATHQNFFPNQNIQLGRTVEMAEPNEFGAISTSEPHSSAAAYNTISMQNQRRFAAQLLPDFVA